jgi:hypothetical protein
MEIINLLKSLGKEGGYSLRGRENADTRSVYLLINTGAEACAT